MPRSSLRNSSASEIEALPPRRVATDPHLRTCPFGVARFTDRANIVLIPPDTLFEWELRSKPKQLILGQSAISVTTAKSVRILFPASQGIYRAHS
jgi:hypothetical protein